MGGRCKEPKVITVFLTKLLMWAPFGAQKTPAKLPIVAKTLRTLKFIISQSTLYGQLQKFAFHTVCTLLSDQPHILAFGCPWGKMKKAELVTARRKEGPYFHLNSTFFFIKKSVKCGILEYLIICFNPPWRIIFKPVER